MHTIFICLYYDLELDMFLSKSAFRTNQSDIRTFDCVERREQTDGRVSLTNDTRHVITCCATMLGGMCMHGDVMD